MKKKLYFILISLLLFVFFNCQQPNNKSNDNPDNKSNDNSMLSNLQFSETSPKQYDYYVDKANGSDTNDGKTLLTAFKTITHGVAVASTGKKIKVSPGIYDVENGEIFPIYLKEGQILIGDVANKGAGKVTTEIKCTITNAGSGLDPNNSCIVAANDMVVKGFIFGNTVSQDFVWAIYCDDNLTVELSNNTFGNNLYGGIFFASGSLISENNDFYTFCYGYDLYNALNSDVLLNNNNIREFTYVPINILSGGNGVVISNNTIIGSGHFGIHITDGSPTIQNNTFNNAYGYKFGAIWCKNNASPKIRSNTFICSNAIIIGNTISTKNNANPDIGNIDKGYNDFSAVNGAAIVKYDNNIIIINAKENTWPGNHYPPTKTDIVVYTAGDRVYYSDTGYITK